MNKRFAFYFAFCLLHFAFVPAFSANTVVWVSIDGLRFDSLDLYKPPTLLRLAKEGAFTKHETPIFPSLTFPNHIAQACGTTVDHTGVPMNAFYDSADKKIYDFPDDASLIRAEPIWAVATRQGVRTCVIDWPMSYNQVGPNASAYFSKAFDKKEQDLDRLGRVIKLLKADIGEPPLRLVMTYCSEVDRDEHKSGPGSDEVKASVLAEDAKISSYLDSVIEWFKAAHAADDELYVLLTTDHGMEDVHTQMNLKRLIGGMLSANSTIVTSGPVGTVSFDRAAVKDVAARVQAIVRKLSAFPYLSVWPSDKAPIAYRFGDPTRIGDVTVLCAPGYTFSSFRPATTAPASDPYGMHGYDPAVCPNMEGCAVVWRYRHPLGGIDLGNVDNTQWHATVAKLLGIQPAADADPRAVELEHPGK